MKNITASWDNRAREKFFAKKELSSETKKPSTSAGKLLSSEDIVYATEVEEFFYDGTDEPVLCGDPVGFDLEVGEGVELVLFDNIYWNPQY